MAFYNNQNNIFEKHVQTVIFMLQIKKKRTEKKNRCHNEKTVLK